MIAVLGHICFRPGSDLGSLAGGGFSVSVDDEGHRARGKVRRSCPDSHRIEGWESSVVVAKDRAVERDV